jgi:hypothetical protein
LQMAKSPCARHEAICRAALAGAAEAAPAIRAKDAATAILRLSRRTV